jgi:hypothetical protein
LHNLPFNIAQLSFEHVLIAINVRLMCVQLNNPRCHDGYPTNYFFKTLPYLGRKFAREGENKPKVTQQVGKAFSLRYSRAPSDIPEPNLGTSSDETALERRDYLRRFGGALPRASRKVPPNGADDREPFQRGLEGKAC